MNSLYSVPAHLYKRWQREQIGSRGSGHVSEGLHSRGI